MTDHSEPRKIISPGNWYTVFDGKGNIKETSYDASYRKSLGFNTEEDPANSLEHWADSIHPDDKARVQDHLRDVLSTHAEGKIFDIEFRMMTGFGSYRWFHVYAHDTRREDGSLARLDGVVFDIQEVKDYEMSQAHDTLKKEVLDFIVNHDDDPIELLSHFAEKIRVLIDCDQVIYRDLEKTRIMVNSPAIEKTWCVPESFCRQCLHFDAHHPMYSGGFTEMDNCQEGWQGIPVYHECPIKSSLTRIVYCNGQIAGYLAIHYVQKYHHFTDLERKTLEEFTGNLSLILSRYESNRKIEEMQRREQEQKEKETQALIQNNQRIMALEDDFESLYDVELESGRYTTFVKGDFYQKNVIDKLQMSGHFFEDLHRNIEDTIHPEDRDGLFAVLDKNAIREALGRDERFEYHYRIVASNGNGVWFKIRIVYKNAEKKNIIIGVFNAETELATKRLEEQQVQLEEALAMAQSANRAKTTFLNNMSHDIRTPMNAIIGYTSLAASHIDNKEQVQDYLCKISQSSDHLLSLINDVLDMSRIESGKVHLEENDENLSEIIHTIRNIVQANVHSRQLDFYIDSVDVHDEEIVCDKLRLNQVLLNVLSNAIKYTPAGGTVSMRIRENRVKDNGYGEYEFIIKDNGIGMSPEFVKTIFDPFTRVKSSTVSGIQGTGLGMAITKNIIDMMGGKIEVASEPGTGTTVKMLFEFKLQSAPKAPISMPKLKGIRGLIVDDDADTCMSVAKMLRDVGIRSLWCTSGKEAVLRAQDAYRSNDLYQLYIIDWLMPGINGIETIRRIRKVVGDDAPVIILTSYDWSDIEEEAREAGVTAFVSKPIFPSDLYRVLIDCFGLEAEANEDVTKPLDLSGKKILVVEDNDLNREIAIAILEEFGGETVSATDGTIAVEMMKNAKAGDFDLVLMDIQMPQMNGYEATRQIRALGTEISKIPILAMTANAFEEDRKAAYKAGMNEHIAKPIDIDKLKSVLAKFL